MNYITSEDEIKINAGIQAIYFYASWMPYHNKFLNMISKIEDKYKDIKFIAIDTDNFKNQCKRYSIESIPAVLVFKDGKEIKRIIGLVMTSAFKSVFVDIYKS